MNLRWWTVLTIVLACGYLVIGVASPLPSVRWPVIAGGILVLAALWLATRGRGVAVAVLVVGALVPVVTGWWSLVVPLTAVLTVLCGTVAVGGVLNGVRRQEATAPPGPA